MKKVFCVILVAVMCVINVAAFADGFERKSGEVYVGIDALTTASKTVTIQDIARSMNLKNNLSKSVATGVAQIVKSPAKTTQIKKVTQIVKVKK